MPAPCPGGASPSLANGVAVPSTEPARISSASTFETPRLYHVAICSSQQRFLLPLCAVWGIGRLCAAAGKATSTPLRTSRGPLQHLGLKQMPHREAFSRPLGPAAAPRAAAAPTTPRVGPAMHARMLPQSLSAFGPVTQSRCFQALERRCLAPEALVALARAFLLASLGPALAVRPASAAVLLQPQQRPPEALRRRLGGQSSVASVQ